MPQGALTPLLYKLGPGDTITARKVAKGRFTLDTASGRTNHLLLCTVTGVAPFVSYARALHKEWKEGTFDGRHKLFVVQGASQSRELGYREELEQLAAEVPWLTYVPTVSRPWDDPEWQGETGRVDDIIRKYTDHWKLDTDTTTRLSLRPPRHDRARQGHPAAARLEEGGAWRRGLLHPQARPGGEGTDARRASS